MFGVINGSYLCNDNRVQTLNKRIFERNIPSNTLPPNVSFRPTSTKYAFMPILDRRAPATVPLNNCQSFNVSSTFNPGNDRAPWSGYANNIHKESTLRNQFFALQPADQKEYVPSSDSDLYNVVVDGNPVKQPFPDLFQKQRFEPFNPNTMNLGKQVFQNHTRFQFKSNVEKSMNNNQ